VLEILQMSGSGNERNLQVYMMLVKIEQIIDSMKRVLEEQREKETQGGSVNSESHVQTIKMLKPHEKETQGGSVNSESHVQMITMLTRDLRKICELINTKLGENSSRGSSFIIGGMSRPYISFFRSLTSAYQEQDEINFNLQYISEFLRDHIDGCTGIISKTNDGGFFDIELKREGPSNIRINTSIEGDIQESYICTHITLI
jgi:hypothetical protein